MENTPSYGWQPETPDPPVFASQAAQAANAAEQNDRELRLLHTIGMLSVQVKSKARWFYFIAGLSLLNSFLFFSDSNVSFLAGLNISTIADVYSVEYGLSMAVPIIFDLLVAGLFVFFGYFASQRKLWAFVVGMSLYALDSLLSLFIQDWLSLAFHAYALFSLFTGLRLCQQLVNLQKTAYPQYPGYTSDPNYPTRETVYRSPQQR